MLARSLRHRAPVLWLLLPFMGGLAAAHLSPVSIPVWILAAGAITGVFLAFAFIDRPGLWSAAVGVALGAAGFCHYQVFRARLPEWDELPPRQVELVLKVERLFSNAAAGKSCSGLGRIVDAGPLLRELAGQRASFSLRSPAPAVSLLPGAEIRVVGVMETLPRSAPTATFDGYLAASGVNFRINRGRILALTREASPYQRFCAAAQRHLAAILDVGLAKRPELAAIARGMLLGQAGELTAGQRELFLRSGTFHLFSVSGLHIAAIAVAVHLLLALTRMPLVCRFFLSAVILWLYVDITGGSPSAVRAYAMVLLVEAACALRRPVNPVATLAASAFVCVLINPLQLFGASFQMSYGIVAGLLLLGLPLGEWAQEKTTLFSQVPKVTWAPWQHALAWCQRNAVASLGIGLATSLVGDIAGLLYFQLFTPGALAANFFLIPISSFALWAGFLSLIFGLSGLTWLSSVFNHASALILLAIQEGIRLCVAVPGAFVKGQFTSATWGFVAFTGLLLLFLTGYAVRWERRFGGFWPPFVWTALALLFAVRYG